MLTLETEVERLRPLLGDAMTNALVARERREVFSIAGELRLLAWDGAMLLATAAGIVLKNNLDRIGPLALAMLMAAAAAACYAWVWIRRARASLADDYVLLLGALLVSGDVAFIESQFHLFGDAWYRHFLVLAVFHGVTAYLFRSRLVLSLSIAALAAWLGLTGGSLTGFQSRGFQPNEFALRAFSCSALLLMWRYANRREEFHVTFEHSAALLALSGASALNIVATLVVAVAVIVWGFRTRRELFVLYAFVWGVVALNIWLARKLDSEVVTFLMMVVSFFGAIVALIAIHARFREARP